MKTRTSLSIADLDLIISCSLDSTVRLWDYSKLKSKYSSNHGAVFALASEVEPFIICEAHLKGVNWVDFHPFDNYFVTCSDDRLIKVYNFNSSMAVE